MHRSAAWLLASVLLVALGCNRGAPLPEAPPQPPGPNRLFWEVAAPGQQPLTAAPGEAIPCECYTATLTAHFDRPVAADQVHISLDNQLWHVGPPAQADPASITYPLWADLAGINPVTIRLSGPVDATLQLTPRTPPSTRKEAAELAVLGQEIWQMAIAGDAEGLAALIAPPEHLAAPGGEFQAEGVGSGLPAILQWAQARAGEPVRVGVEPRQGYASMDLIVLEVGPDRLAIYVTIPGRRLVKLYGLSSNR